jgi:NAD(P)H-dependent flavin oxidoreductase YrpB (nitropropane dioxygenase family)
MGTRFLLTKESPMPEAAKARYLTASTDDIAVTSKVDGIPQRMLRTPLFDRIERSGPLGMWLRALEGALVMKRRTGASWGELIAAGRSMTSHGGLSFAQAMMAAAAPTLIQRAVVDGDVEHGLLATGLVAGRITELPSCAELIDSIEREARARIATLTGARASAAA